MKIFIATILSVLFVSPCFSQQDIISAYPKEINYIDNLAYFYGVPFTGILVDAKTSKQLGEFKNGYKEGLFTEYYANGTKKSECNYTKGKQNGACTEWFLNGQKKSAFVYENGIIANGTYTLYSEDGLSEEMETYKGGKKVSEDLPQSQAATNQTKDAMVNQTKDNDASDKMLTEMLKIVKIQAQQDSLMRIDLRKMQEQLAKQNEQLNKTVAEISNSKSKTDTTYKSVLNKIEKNGEKQQEQIDSAVAAINRMNVTIKNSENEKHKKWKPKPVGIGIDVAGVLNKSLINSPSSSTSYTYNNYAPLVIFLSINPSIHFRMEVEFAALIATGSSPIYYFAGGMFGMWQSGKTNFYTGLKAMRFFDENITLLTPTIGAEYAFGNHFTFGGEIGFPFAVENNNAVVGFGFNRLILRFYLGGKK